MEKQIRGRQIYTLDMYLAGIPFKEFARRAKRQLLLSCLDLADDVRVVEVHFHTLPLSKEEIYLEISKYRRSDGLYVLSGEFTPFEKIADYVTEHARVISLDGKIIT